MTITFDIPDDKLNTLISALTSAIDNAQFNREDADRNEDHEMIAAWESDERILAELLAQVEAQTKGRA
jgi:hypothetical protein